MTTAAPPTDSVTNQKQHHAFDPDQYRMTIGEHLEELRGRLVKGLVGFAVALAVCLVFSDRVISTFCEPLLRVLREEAQNPQLVVDNVTEGFMVYMTISLISAAALASPWLLYQIWQFVGAGLYPHERKYITKYLPLSVFLLIGGMVFVYYVVLPLTLSFLIHFSVGIKLPGDDSPIVTRGAAAQVAPTTNPTTGPSTPAAPPAPLVQKIPVLQGDPANPQEGDMWINDVQKRFKIFYQGQTKVVTFGSDELLRPEITLGSYINLVVAMLLSFGIAFQLPLVVLAVERIGIADVEALRRSRKYVYFVIMVASAIISPGDAITATVAMFIPLIFLYELGIWLAMMGKKPQPAT
jgi:Sec-independent protein secretion pathway component TatC